MKHDQVIRNGCKASPPEGLVDVAAQIYQSEGRFYLPALEIASGTTLRDSDQAMMVQLEMASVSPIGNSIGMFVRFTPEGARLFAQKLLSNAIKVEAHVAKQASAAIEAARQNGGPASSSGAVGPQGGQS